MLKAKAARHTLTSLHALKIEQTSKRGSQQTGPQPNTTHGVRTFTISSQPGAGLTRSISQSSSARHQEQTGRSHMLVKVRKESKLSPNGAGKNQQSARLF